MRSQSGQQMLQILQQLRLYRLKPDSLVYAELSAYDAGFQLLEKKIKQLSSVFAVLVAPSEFLSRYEEMVGLRVLESGSTRQRRQMVQQRLEISPQKITHSSMENDLVAAGIQGQIFANSLLGTLEIHLHSLLDPSRSLEEIHQYLEKLLPAHLEWFLEYGTLTFQMLDDQAPTWDDWNNKDFHWDTFDKEGESLFT